MEIQMGIQRLLKEAQDLPADERLELANNLLESLNIDDQANAKLWLDKAKARLQDIEDDSVETASKADVLKAARGRVTDDEG
jgi:hypothetical protein